MQPQIHQKYWRIDTIRLAPTIVPIPVPEGGGYMNEILPVHNLAASDRFKGNHSVVGHNVDETTLGFVAMGSPLHYCRAPPKEPALNTRSALHPSYAAFHNTWRSVRNWRRSTSPIVLPVSINATWWGFVIRWNFLKTKKYIYKIIKHIETYWPNIWGHLSQKHGRTHGCLKNIWTKIYIKMRWTS